jgi:DNA-binding NarL/FixJ family response regulator
LFPFQNERIHGRSVQFACRPIIPSDLAGTASALVTHRTNHSLHIKRTVKTHEHFLEPAERASEAHVESARRTGRGPTQLWLVDDNSTFRELLAALLIMEGEVECTGQFSSAEAALRALENGIPPEAILLDIQMGEECGLDAIQPIKALAASTHIFMLTTFFDHDRKVRALENGASGFLLKSYPAAEILRQIQQVQGQPVPTGIQRAIGKRPEHEHSVRSDPGSSRRPQRRALASGNGRAERKRAIQLHPEDAPRDTTWKCASRGFLRSVGRLRTLLGILH